MAIFSIIAIVLILSIEAGNMDEIILYTDISNKKSTSLNSVALSDIDALIYTLDIIDFNTALIGQNIDNIDCDDSIDWLELELTKNDH